MNAVTPMQAVWYDEQGPAAAVLRFGVVDTPEPAAGEVRVRLTRSGVNPGDTKKREGWLGSAMPYPRVIPHSDGAGVVDQVGVGVAEELVGLRVAVHGAQSYRQFGTAAEYVVVPERLAVPLPDEVGDDVAASLGIPGITAHRAVFADGPVHGRTVLVQGVRGAVGSLAAQLAVAAGATVIGTVRRSGDLEAATSASMHVVALDADPVAAVRAIAPDGVDRIIEVALDANADLDAAVIANDGVIATYFARGDRVDLPFPPLLFANVLVRFLGSDDFDPDVKRAAMEDLVAGVARGEVSVTIGSVLPLAEAAAAHELVDAGRGGRVLLDTTR
ncbi:zinc-binding dehydrogenase [Curtobacterium sp. MCPF17_002]|uniref:alcohol dehydrogenase catalytic domain-containing protein n=1 Tax=Curtobacterium sp. MCPF17_002 TaxID=2175645 RepID=UPI001C649001|nr:zinc-binding dehydrogenase [Curtobacterium sp. MCPF17_002]WIB78274.1 zinc-binding dehydrogenase [Curtobacterium sp. MCPF17_002]